MQPKFNQNKKNVEILTLYPWYAMEWSKKPSHATVPLIPEFARRRCILTCEYLREFSKKFETVLMAYSGAGVKLIDEKNQKRKISWHCPFKYLGLPGGGRIAEPRSQLRLAPAQHVAASGPQPPALSMSRLRSACRCAPHQPHEQARPAPLLLSYSSLK